MGVAWSRYQRTASQNTEWTQIHFDCDWLLLQVGWSCAHAVLPPFSCGEAHCGHHCPLWIPHQDPVQTPSWHRPKSGCTVNYTAHIVIESLRCYLDCQFLSCKSFSHQHTSRNNVRNNCNFILFKITVWFSLSSTLLDKHFV